MSKRRAARKTVTADEYLLDLDIEALESGSFVATSPQVQGLVAQGRTLAETIEIARDVARRIFESCLKYGDPPPVLRRKPRRRLATTVPISLAR
jgi:predicted RNase H-like HicB family nuclease